MNQPLKPETPDEPHWLSRSAFQIVVFLFLFTQIALFFVLKSGVSLWFAVPLVLIASHLMHGAAVGLHEATHGRLRPNRTFNEFDGVLIGTFSFLPFSLYRAAHQSHHAYLATERDEELWPFVFPGTPRWARVLAAMLELTFGFLYTPFLFFRTFLRKGSPIRNRKVRRRIWKEVALIVVVWTGILAAVGYWNVWPYFFWMYLAPAFLTGNLQAWRKYIEHVGMTGHTPNSATRSIVAEDRIGRLVSFTLLHEPYHGLHHLHAGLSHAELPGLVADLHPTTRGELHPFPSYRHALMDLLRCLGDPRVGSQWGDVPNRP